MKTITVVSVVQGFTSYVSDFLQGLGTNAMWVWPERPPGDAGKQDVAVSGARCRNPDNQARGRHDAIVCAEHGGPKPANSMRPVFLVVTHGKLAGISRISIRRDVFCTHPNMRLAGTSHSRMPDISASRYYTRHHART